MAETFINGSFNGSNAQYLTFKCGWEVLSQDKANKTSTVRLRWIVTKTISNLGTFKSNAPWSQTVDGTTTSGSLNFNLGNVAANTDYVIRTDVVTIAHNANGTKTAAISGSLDLSGTSAGIGSFSGSMALPTIATDPPTGLSIAVSDMWTHPTGIASSTYVGGYSRLKLTASATPVSPATIANYAFYANDALLYSGTNTSYTYPQPLEAGTYVFKLVVTDSYGNSSTKTHSVTVLPYRMPSVYAEAYRCAGANDDTPDPSGVYVCLRIQASYSNNISGNSLVVRQTVLGGNTYTWSYDSASRIEGTFPTTNSYNAVFTVTDVIGNSATAKVFIPTEFVNFDLYPDSEVGGAAFGMIAKQGLFSVNHDAEFLGDTAFGGALIAGDSGGSVMLNHINFANITEYVTSDTTTSTAGVDKLYTVSGNGIIFASCSIEHDATSAAGSAMAAISKNNVYYAFNLVREGATTAQTGASASAFMKVTSGDVINLRLMGTKASSTKTRFYNILAIGCTVSTS